MHIHVVNPLVPMSTTTNNVSKQQIMENINILEYIPHTKMNKIFDLNMEKLT